MRRMTTILGAVLGLALLTGSAAAATTPATTTPVSAAAATVTTSSASTAAARKTLGPKGVGALKLGMNHKQAKATKLLKKRKGEDHNSGCRDAYTLKGAPVFYSRKLGIASITAYKGLATPQGIKLGSSAKAVKKAYPSWRSLTDEGLTGRGLVKVPGNRKAHYNITISRGKVTYLQLQLRNQNCYE